MAQLAPEITGLSASEVEERKRRGAQNRHVTRPTRTYLQIVRANVFSLYNVILLGAFLVLLVIQGPGSSVFPAAIVIINMVLGLIQEIRAKRALDRLAAVSVRTVSARRDGRTDIIPIEDIVQDDVLELSPGESVVVDGSILASDSLEIDESQLTGESEFVPKQPGDRITSGSFCGSGAGLMLAERVGSESHVSGLAELARGFKRVRTPLEQQLDTLVKVLVGVMLFLAPLTLLGGRLRGLAPSDSLENVVNLMSSLVPQGLLVFVAISFAYGVVNITRFQALIQRPNAIELMGHVTCLCADKTGTLTENLLAVTEIVPLGEADEDVVLRKLASFVENVSWQNKTVAALAAFAGASNESMVKLAEVPFTSQRKWSSITFSSGETLLLGAPELLLTDPIQQAEAQRLSSQGLRVLAMAVSAEQARDQQSVQAASINSIALIALRDQLRPDIAATLRMFDEQGIVVKVISGDSPETVSAIARQAGMSISGPVTGEELERMEPSQMAASIREANLFARIAPETKRKIVAALVSNGTVAMVGDGVNDVPALKAAHLAVAMNNGAQIAKDVSDIILLNNAFSTLPAAFFEGRELTQRLYGIARINLVKVVYLSMLFVLAGYAGLPWPATLLQTTWLSLVTLTVPAMLIIFRFLPVPIAANREADLLRYVLVWGVTGGAALIILYTAIMIGVRESPASGRTAVIAFAGLYNSLVLWDIYKLPWSFGKSFWRSWKPALAGFSLGLVGALMPSYLLSRALGLERPGSMDMLLVLLLLCASYLALLVLNVRSE